jgi:hypothetical protein
MTSEEMRERALDRRAKIAVAIIAKLSTLALSDEMIQAVSSTAKEIERKL